MVPKGSDPHLRLDRVTKRYGAVTALHEIDVAVEAGELLTLLGPSGCGKTTVLRLVAGFIEPSAGRILIDEVPVTHLPPNRRAIGMVFQSYALFPHLTIAQNIGFGLEEHGLPRARIRERVGELLELIQLSDAAQRYPAQLSGGQQQRVALARAVAHAPRVLLMDEPLGALDLKLREAMQVEIRRIQKTLGITTLYVTHDQTEAMRISDRVAVMNRGRIEQCGTVAEIYVDPQTRFVADFIGKINFIRGRIITAEGVTCVVHTEVGTHRCAAVDGFSVGEEVALGIRPDDITVAPAPGVEQGGIRVTGTIEEIAFLGTFDELRVRVSSSLSFQIETRPGGAPGVTGDAVEISWKPERCKLFRAE